MAKKKTSKKTAPAKPTDAQAAVEKPSPKKKAPRKKKSEAAPSLDEAFGAWMSAAKERWPGSIEIASGLPVDGTPTMSTGNFVLDRMTYGGLRRGRLYRFWGVYKSAKTGSALNCCEAFTSNHCGRCYEHRLICKCEGDFVFAKALYVDVEGRIADNRPWAEAHGIHPDRLAMVAPKGGEQVVDIADAALRSDAGIGLIVIDSLAQMTAVDEVTKAAEKGKTIGRNAMLINSALRKWVCSIVSKDIASTRKPTIILINQIRKKTSSFGCFHSDTPVMFADGSQHSIKDVVEQRLTGPVLSWDGERVVERTVTGWHDNGLLEEGQEWLTFRTEGTGGRRGAIGFTCTPNHVLVTEDGKEVAASEVRVGSHLLSWYEQTLSRIERDVIVGSLFGDGHLHATDGRDAAASLVLANQEQPDYLEWKLNLIRSLGFTRRPSANGRVAFATNSSFELGLLRQKFYKPRAIADSGKNYRQIPLDVLEDASLLTLAVWYMDDGHLRTDGVGGSISIKRLSPTNGRLVARTMTKRYEASYQESQKTVRFTAAGFRRFSRDIACFVPPCMAYKLLPEHRAEAGCHDFEDSMIGRCVLEAPNPGPILTRGGRDYSFIGRKRREAFAQGLVVEPRRRTIGSKVTKIHTAKRKMRSRRKYDLTVEGDSFYLVGGDSRGVVVHNSPDVMPGGEGQGYASACDIKFTKRQKHYLMPDGKGGFGDKVVKFGGKWKPGEDDTADFIEIEAKVTDSGICPPGRYGTFHYWMRAGHGRRCGDTDNTLWLWDYSKKYELLKKNEKGQGYTLMGLAARTQKDMEKLFLEDIDVQEKVWIKLMDILSS